MFMFITLAKTIAPGAKETLEASVGHVNVKRLIVSSHDAPDLELHSLIFGGYPVRNGSLDHKELIHGAPLNCAKVSEVAILPTIDMTARGKIVAVVKNLTNKPISAELTLVADNMET